MKAAILLIALPLIMIGLTVYALHARGVFEPSRKVVLLADDVEGVDVGMPIMFSGFPIGTVSRMGLSEDANVWIELAVRERDARWLRTSTVFSLVRPLVGGARLRAESPRMQDPPLPPDAKVRLEVEDAAAALPLAVARVDEVLANIERITRPGSELERTLAHLEAVASRMSGKRGLLSAVTGSDEGAERVLASVDRLNATIASLQTVVRRVDRVVAKAESQVLGPAGITDETRKAVVQFNTGLGELRGAIAKLDATMENARAATVDIKAVTGSAREATVDLAELRSEVDASVRKANDLLREINRKWPFARDERFRLP